MPDILYIVCVDGVETEDIYSSLSAAKKSAGKYIPTNKKLMIKDTNSLSPDKKWLYDYILEDWVPQS